MAAVDKSLKKIEEQLTCSVCLEFYEDPKLLLCLHVFCKDCLEKLLSKTSIQHQGQPALQCPSCRKPTPVPESGVSGLEPAFYINNLFEVRSSLVSKPREGPQNPTSSHKPSHVPTVSLGLCPVHTNNELQLFCSNCQDIICFECTLEKHATHSYDLVGDLVKQHKAELSSALTTMENRLADAEKGMALVTSRFKGTFDLRDSVEEEIFQAFEEAEQILRVRKTALINKLYDLTQDNIKCLVAERDRKETVHAQILGTLEILRASLEAKSDVEMLKGRQHVLEIVSEASKGIEKSSDLLAVGTDADVQFTMPPDFLRSLKDMGDIRGPDSPHPKSCTASGEGLKWAEVGKTSVVLLKVKTDKGEPFQKPIKSLEGELIDPARGTTVKCTVKKKDTNVYKLSYEPTKRGKHQLHLKVSGAHIKGSPFPIAARIPIEQIRTPTLVIKDLQHPWGVTTTPKGDIVVTECNSHIVTIFNARGEKVRTFGSSAGTGKLQFRQPCGVAVDDMGHIFVADTGNRRIQKFTEEGQFIACVGQKGKGPLEFIDPKDMVFNTFSNKLYIADSPRVQVLNSNLTFSAMIGTSARGQLNNSFGIACDSVGDIYVSDNKNMNIQKYSASGHYLKTFTPNPSGWLGGIWPGVGAKNPPPALTVPVTIAVDSRGLMYVSDENTEKICVLSPEGETLVSFGSAGSAVGQFRKPRVISVDECGVVYVCDRNNGRVQVF